jgi:hypothetical protein
MFLQREVKREHADEVCLPLQRAAVPSSRPRPLRNAAATGGRMKRCLLVMSTVLLGWLAGPPVFAEDPCYADVQRFCPDVEVGSSRIAVCLRANTAKLTASCRERLDANALKARRLIEAFGRACGKDVQDFCPGVEAGEGRVLRCLEQRQLELSASCQAQLILYGRARDRVEHFRAACTSDLERLCKGVPHRAVPLRECLEANEAQLSSGCSRDEIRQAIDAASIVDSIEEVSRGDRLRETLQILQGVDSVAFARSQVLLQYDSYRQLAGVGNGTRLLFNPQFVFGQRREFSLQAKVPITTLYLGPSGTLHGLGDITTAFAWNLNAEGPLRHYLSFGLRWRTAAEAAFGGAWALQPAYAVATRLAQWVSFTLQLAWFRSLGPTDNHTEINAVLFEPIVVANLPGRSFLALDTKLLWNLVDGSFVPVMKGVAGLFTDRQKALSISVWYEASLTDAAVSQSFQYGLGLSLAYYFDW